MKYQIIIKHLKSGDEVFNEKCDAVICGICDDGNFEKGFKPEGFSALPSPDKYKLDEARVGMAMQSAQEAIRKTRERYLPNKACESIVIEDGYGISDLREEEK